MSSPYPILDNRPIDKWKVTELKEELKRRKLTTRGLKEDLVRRLDEALRIESENAQIINLAAEKINQEAAVTPEISQVTPIAAKEKAFTMETSSAAAETTPASVEVAALQKSPVHAKVEDNLVKNDDDDGSPAGGIDNPIVDVKQQEALEGYVKDESAEKASGVVAGETVVAEEDAMDTKNKESRGEMDDENSKLDPENEGLEAQATDGTSASKKQVSEVSLVTGLEVTSDCISTTDSVSNNEKIEMKDDNIIDENIKLEHNVIKSQEVVEPSSVGGESHPMDVEEPLEQKVSDGGRDDVSAANADMMNKGNDNINAGDSEKLNLDRSSGDDSMDEEEEEADGKQTKANKSDEIVNKSEKSGVSASNAESPRSLPERENNKPQVASEKRKLPANDGEAGGDNEAVKRQRRWNNSENIKVAQEVETSDVTPKPAGLKRQFARSNSTASEDGPKERVVPLSQKEATNSLRIDCFLRPFTLKAVHELLGKTGSVTSFWMDHIKTHCYVSYSSVEEATATRDAVYNLQWPPNGGRLLKAEFVGPEEVKAKVEAPMAQATAAAPQAPPLPARAQGSKAQVQLNLPPQTTGLPPPPPPPPLTMQTPAREHLLPPPPPPPVEELPIVTLDDLFRKTKATPRIYYLPLSDEQVAAKLAARGGKGNDHNK